MKKQFENVEDIVFYIYEKYIKQDFNPFDIRVEYIKNIINYSINKIIEHLYHQDKYDLLYVNNLKMYKYRDFALNGKTYRDLKEFIQNNSIDLDEVYNLCSSVLKVNIPKKTTSLVS